MGIRGLFHVGQETDFKRGGGVGSEDTGSIEGE